MSFLTRATSHLIERAPHDGTATSSESINAILVAYVKDGLWEELDSDLLRLRASGLIDDDGYAAMTRDLSGNARAYQSFLARYRTFDPSFSP